MKRDYLSASALKAFATSPNHYLQYVQGNKKASKAMEFGTLVHTILLERNEVWNRYVIDPKMPKRSNVDKAAWKEWQEANKHLEIIDQEFYNDAAACSEAALSNPLFLELMSQPLHFEEKLEGDVFGFPFVARLDMESDNFVYDLKTCQDASPEGFMKAAYNFGYHEQAAIYRILTGKPFRWVALETAPPYNLVIFEQSEDAFTKAAGRVMKLVEQFKAWDGTPRSYTDQITTLDLPRWA